MDIQIYNGTPDKTLLFYSDKSWKKGSIFSYLPKLTKMLSILRDMEFASDHFMRYIEDIKDYIRSSLKPEFTYMDDLAADDTFYVTDYELPRYLYIVSFIRPTKMTISLDKIALPRIAESVSSLLVYLSRKNGITASDRVSSIFRGKSKKEVREVDEAIHFELAQKPYRKVELNTGDLKQQLVDGYKKRYEDLVDSSDASSFNWQVLVIILLVLIVIVVVVAGVGGFIMARKKNRASFTERHITNVYQEEKKAEPVETFI